MTAREKLSLEKLSNQFSDYMEEDRKWKEEVKKQLDPLVDERMDRLIIQKYGGQAFKVLAFIVGLLASAGAAWKYLIGPFFGYR